MPVFLNQERTKIGTTTGTLIAFPQELEVNDPAVGNSLSLLPSGYLRCDGKIYNESVYPALAEVIGTGATCAFKQEGVTLSDSQFQVPDLRSKFIKASSSSDQGVVNDNTVINAAGQTIERSGVSVNVSSNVGNVATVDMTGQFRVPPRTVNLTGNVGFTRPRAPDEEIIGANAFLPHAHFTTTLRSRTIRRSGSDIYELNYYTNASTIGVLNWFDNTGLNTQPLGENCSNIERQPACRHWKQSEAWNDGAWSATGFSVSFEYYGICKGGCLGFSTSCLVPTGRTIDLCATPEGPCWQNVRILFVTLRLSMTCYAVNKTVAATYAEGIEGVGNDDIPTTTPSTGGVLQSFSLYENLNVTAGFVSKGLGQWSYSTAGSYLWSSLGEFATGEVDMFGGTGTGMRLTVRFEAWPGNAGLPTNTRYKVVAVTDGGTGYSAADELTFGNLGAYTLSSSPTEFRLKVNTTSYGVNIQDSAGYAHNTSLHNVLPVDTVADNSVSVAYPQVSNIIETTLAFDYEDDPTQHTHTINYTTGLTNYQLNIPETFISTDGMSASININAESDTKIDNLIQPFVMVEYLIKT